MPDEKDNWDHTAIKSGVYRFSRIDRRNCTHLTEIFCPVC